MRATFPLLLFLAPAPALAEGHTWIVDAAGSGDFADLQSAVDAASDGDLIRVHAGSYASFTITGKGLAVVAEGPGVTTSMATLTGGGPEHDVLLSGLELTGGSKSLVVLDWKGSVRAQSCWMETGAGVLDSPDVAFVACDVNGAYAAASSLASFLSRCDRGLVADDGASLFVGGSAAVGLDGGPVCDLPQDGHPGLSLHENCTGYAVGSAFAGGMAGYCNGYCSWCQDDAVDGPPVALDPTAVLEQFEVQQRKLMTDRDATPDCGTLQLMVQGEPGDEVALAWSRRTAFELRPEVLGLWGLGAPNRTWRLDGGGAGRSIVPQGPGGDTWLPFELASPELGTIPPSGRLVLELPLESVGDSFTTVHLQARVRTSAGEGLLTNPWTVVVYAATDTCRTRSYVDAGALPGGDGSTWELAFQELSEALEHARTHPRVQEIWVAEGVYAADGPGDTFDVPPGVRVFGGFAGGEASLEERDVDAHPTVLTEADGYHVVTIAPMRGQRLDGLRIEGGSAEGFGGPGSTYGGGIYAYDRRPLQGAVSHYVGGWFDLVGCEIQANSARSAGAGMYAIGGSVVVLDTDFVDNQTTGSAGTGGGVLKSRGELYVANSKVERNTAVYYAGLAVSGTRCLAVNTAITGNASTIGPAGLRAIDMFVELVHCTIAQNAADLVSGGLSVQRTTTGDAALELHGCVVWGNLLAGSSGAATAQVAVDREVVLHTSFNCVQDLVLSGVDDFDLDPEFLDELGPDGLPGTGDEDLRLGPTSPCVDSGRFQVLPPDEFDLDGDANPFEKIPYDLDGAPRRQDDPNVPDSGPGSPPCVDRGAFERAGS